VPAFASKGFTQLANHLTNTNDSLQVQCIAVFRGRIPSNAGPSSASNVVVKDTLPDEVSVLTYAQCGLMHRGHTREPAATAHLHNRLTGHGWFRDHYRHGQGPSEGPGTEGHQQ
jgi:hypothetical protein